MTGKYEDIGAEIGRLVDKKQKAYGRSFEKTGQILLILYPNGIKPDQYNDILAMVRILDKFFRIASDKTALGENPWKDTAGYSILMNNGLMDALNTLAETTADKRSFLAPFSDGISDKESPHV